MNILVIGELGEDQFVYCKTNRFAPEMPVPVVQPIRTIKNPGLAGNTLANFKSLRPGWKVDLISNEVPIVKRRYIDDTTGHWFLRVDENDTVDSIGVLDKGRFIGYDAVVVSDYGKGLLTDDSLNFIIEDARQLGIPSFVDTKKNINDLYAAFCFKINNFEYLSHRDPPEESGITLVRTLGQAGAILYRSGTSLDIPTTPREVACVSGCGDTFMAGLVCKYLECKELIGAVKYANLVAGAAAMKRGVVTVTEEDLMS